MSNIYVGMDVHQSTITLAVLMLIHGTSDVNATGLGGVYDYWIDTHKRFFLEQLIHQASIAPA